MWKYARLLALAVIFSAVLNTPLSYADGLTPPETMAPAVLVGLFQCDQVTLTCQGPFQISGSGGSVSLPANLTAKFWAQGNRVVTEATGTDGAMGTGALMVVPASETVGVFITVREHVGADCPSVGNSYAGSILVMAQGDRLCVANLVDAESYVKSVVSSEMPDLWPEEALRAQAVAVRSYLLYKLQVTRTPGFGLPDYHDYPSLTPDRIGIWATDQIYRGVLAHRDNAVNATEHTRGQVLTYGALPVAAYFHASAEGMTEDVSNVWGAAIPYLIPVVEEPYESKYSSWTVDLSEKELASSLTSLGVVSPILSVRGCDPGESGRWCGVTVGGAMGEARVKGTDFRRALGQPLRSLLFSTYTRGGGQNSTADINPALTVWVTDGIGKNQETAKDLFVQGGGGIISTGGSGLRALSGSTEEGPLTFTFEGKGWGHGVGMSQWGARASALAGEDHPSILSRYYPGTALELWW